MALAWKPITYQTNQQQMFSYRYAFNLLKAKQAFIYVLEYSK